MGSYQHTQVEISIDGQTYKVPATFASIQAYLGYSGFTPAQILGYTAGQFEQNLSQIESALKALNWSFIKSSVLQYAPDTPAEALQIISDFAAGNFALLDEAFAALRDFLSKYDDATPLMTAFSNIDGYGEAVEEALKQFNENAANQIFVGEPGQYDIEFGFKRADYKVELGPDGNMVITGPGGGFATLVDIHLLQFSDIKYNLTIATKAASVSQDALKGIVDLYIAYFNRVPEADGLGYWIDKFKSGMSLEDIAKQFYSDAITLGDITGYSNDMPLRDYIVMAYANILGRTGDLVPDADVDWWVREISEGRASRDDLPARFISDSRIVANDPGKADQWGWMKDYLDNRVELGVLHAVTYGVDYLSQEDAHNLTVALTKLVTAEGYAAALSLLGLSADDYP